MNDLVRDESRIATASIRGYYYQFLQTAISWLALEQGEKLICEGSEDVDKHIMANQEVEFSQFKHYKGNVTETSEEIKAILLNFVKDYIFYRQRGFKVRMIFRTTAGLGKAQNPLLGRWLSGGAVDYDNLHKKIRDYAAAQGEHGDDEGIEATDYLKGKGLLGDFASSFEWHWGECDYVQIRSLLVERLRKDARCNGISPNALADSMIAQIAWLSSSERNEFRERTLDSFAFDLLISDHLLDQQCTEFGAPQGLPPILHVAYHETAFISVVVAGRFGSVQQVRDLLAGLENKMQNHPEGPVAGDILDCSEGRKLMSEVDVDLYAIFGTVEHAKRRVVKYRWLARRVIEQALARGDVTELSLEHDWQVDEMIKMRFIDAQLIARSLGDPIARYTRRVAESLAQRADPSQNGQWELLNRMISRKLRFVLNWDTHDIFTQENPLP